MPDYAYQDDGIEFLRARPRALIADEPGLGKSRQALLAAVEPVLIVAPAMIHDMHTWQDEIAKWCPEMDATFVSYHELRQRKVEKRQVNKKDADGKDILVQDGVYWVPLTNGKNERPRQERADGVRYPVDQRALWRLGPGVE